MSVIINLILNMILKVTLSTKSFEPARVGINKTVEVKQ